MFYTNISAMHDEELALKDAKIRALQVNINPHFLNNTLECIRGVALEREVPEISTIIASLARILRYSLEENMAITLRDEVDCVTNYMKIINIRKGGKYAVKFELDERTLDNRVIKMLLQPLVENAVVHGLERRLEDGILTLRSEYVGEDRIRITVMDNGVGMSPEVLESLNMQLGSKNLPPRGNMIHGLGVLNSNQRIRLIYGEEYGIRLLSEEGSGSTVIIEIPVNLSTSRNEKAPIDGAWR
jgi:two-component system sensor histidine kinase YesM